MRFLVLLSLIPIPTGSGWGEGVQDSENLSHHFHTVLEYATAFQGANKEKIWLRKKSCRKKILGTLPLFMAFVFRVYF